MNLQEIQQQLEEGINSGSLTLEEMHKQVSAVPFDELAKIEPITDTVTSFRMMHDNAVSGFYELVRTVNRQAGETTRDFISKTGM